VSSRNPERCPDGFELFLVEDFALAQLATLGPVALASKIGHFPLLAKAIVPVAILKGLSLDKKHFLFQVIFLFLKHHCFLLKHQCSELGPSLSQFTKPMDYIPAPP
jgi:hypothetical protein